MVNAKKQNIQLRTQGDRSPKFNQVAREGLEMG